MKNTTARLRCVILTPTFFYNVENDDWPAWHAVQLPLHVPKDLFENQKHFKIKFLYGDLIVCLCYTTSGTTVLTPEQKEVLLFHICLLK